MTVENATYIVDLNELAPAGSEYIDEGDNHLRVIKAVLKNSFQGFSGSIVNYCGTTTNTGNNYTVTTSFNIPAYTEGMIVLCFINSANTGASYLRINSLPLVPIKTMKGDTLEGGELKSNQLAMLIYKNGSFYLINSDADYELINSRYTSATNLTLDLFNNALALGFQNWANAVATSTAMAINNIK